MRVVERGDRLRGVRVRETTLGVVDIGSNTVHLLVGRTNGRGIVPLLDISEALRLGADLEYNDAIRPEKIQELVGTLLNFQQAAADAGVDTLHLLATQAIRMSSNKEEVCAAITEATQLQVQILTPQQEAEFAFVGAEAVCPSLGPQAVVDIGGGSMQIAVGERGKVWDSVSLPLGAARVGMRFLPSDPPTYVEEALLTSYLHNVVPPALPLPDTALTGVLGVGGTLRRIPPLLDLTAGEIIPDATLGRFLSSLTGRTTAEIVALYPIKEERARLLLPALLTIREVLKGYDAPFIVAPYGLREGALLRLSQNPGRALKGVA